MDGGHVVQHEVLPDLAAPALGVVHRLGPLLPEEALLADGDQVDWGPGASRSSPSPPPTRGSWPGTPAPVKQPAASAADISTVLPVAQMHIYILQGRLARSQKDELHSSAANTAGA